MPCYDYRDDVRDTFREDMLKGQVAHRDAMLCAFFRYAQKFGKVKEVLDGLDYVQCGIERAAFEKWWELHQKEDAEKQAAEAAAKAKKAETAKKNKARRELIASLTKEQRELLGLKSMS